MMEAHCGTRAAGRGGGRGVTVSARRATGSDCESAIQLEVATCQTMPVIALRGLRSSSSAVHWPEGILTS